MPAPSGVFMVALPSCVQLLTVTFHVMREFLKFEDLKTQLALQIDESLEDGF